MGIIYLVPYEYLPEQLHAKKYIFYHIMIVWECVMKGRELFPYYHGNLG
jgi:hypothetical protein